MACSHCGSRAGTGDLALFLDQFNNYISKNMYVKIRRTKPNWNLKQGHVYLHKDIDPDILKMGLQLRWFRKTDETEYLKYNPVVINKLPVFKEKTPEVKELIVEEKIIKIEKELLKENVDTKPIGEEPPIRKLTKRGRPKKRKNRSISPVEGNSESTS